MTPAQARRAMRKPRHTKRGNGGIREGWYYVEPEGITVLAKAWSAGTATQVRLTWKQIRQAIELKRVSEIGNEAPQ